MKKAVKSVEEVKAILKEHKAEVVRKYRVREIGISGSFVLKLIEMEIYLEKLLRKKVDVVIKSGIRPELKKGILKEVVYI